jgi:hypothetical protein
VFTQLVVEMEQSRSASASPALSVQAADAESVVEMVQSLAREKGTVLSTQSTSVVVKKATECLVVVLQETHACIQR